MAINLLSADNISKQFGDRWLLRNLNFGINQGEKIALVGANGTGKTTLVRMLVGADIPDEGTIAIKKETGIGYLPQEPNFGEAKTISEAIFRVPTPAFKAIEEYELSLEHADDIDRLQHAMEQMDKYNAWEYEAKVKQILGRFDLHNLEKPISELSGGQKKRVALAQLLISEPDVLILDEPTNHLDLDTIEWLEGFLSSAETTLLLITHDRYFLDAVCNRIVELENAQIYNYEGNYGYFLEKKAEREASLQTEIDKAKNLFKKELDWIRKQPRARGTKAKYRVENFENIKEKAQQNNTKTTLELNMKTARLGNKILEMEHINKFFNDKETIKKIINDFSYVFKKGDRIGVVGRNGVGKSTFLKLLTQQIEPNSGTISIGETITFGYYSQDALQYGADQRVIDVIKEIAEIITLGNGQTITATQFLTTFLFPPETQYKMVDKLSGGEKRRLQLMKILVKSPNFLILDEPTNDLDIQTLNVLEDFLEKFSGCLLLVSHDRYFMDKLVDRLFIFDGTGEIRDFNGNYTDYKEELEDLELEQKTKNKQKNPPKLELKAEISVPKEDNKRKLSFKEKQELEAIEKEMALLETEKIDLNKKLAGENVQNPSAEDFKSWSANLLKINKILEEKEMRWLELSE